MKYSEFKDFEDYCKKTGQDQITAINTLMDELEKLKMEK
jgi:dihydroorotate dehydrogenase